MASRLKSRPAAAAWERADPAKPMEFALPLFAVQCLANGQWLVRTQMGDPILPVVDVVVVVGAQTDIRRDPESAAAEAASASGIAVISITASRRVCTFMLLNCSCRPCGVSGALKFYLQLGPAVYAAERQGARPGLARASRSRPFQGSGT